MRSAATEEDEVSSLAVHFFNFFFNLSLFCNLFPFFPFFRFFFHFFHFSPLLSRALPKTSLFSYKDLNFVSECATVMCALFSSLISVWSNLKNAH